MPTRDSPSWCEAPRCSIRLRALGLGRGAPMRVVLAEARAGNEVVLTLGAAPTLVEARRRARMEMAERLSGFFAGDEPRVRASRRELGKAAIDTNSVQLYSRRQLRDAGKSRGGARAIQADVQLEWSPLREVGSPNLRYLPTQLLYYKYAPSRVALGRADSNGVAAGRTFTDAASRALLELIERDSVALWWYNRVQRPQLDLERAADPFVRRMHAWYRRTGRECWALDLTSDLGIPVVAAVSRRTGAPPEEIVLGFGAHVDFARATRRALLETGQMLALASAARRGSVTLPTATKRWLRRAAIATHKYLRPSGEPPIPLRGNRAERESRAAFRDCCGVLAKHDMRVLVADLTREEFRTPVARVVVPGLRPWWPRFAPGRLYEAPVAAGWIDRPTPESRLNPEPVFF